MYQWQYHQPSGVKPRGSERYGFAPGAVPKKSPSGAQTLGSFSPSSLICSTSSRSRSRPAGAAGSSSFIRMPLMARAPDSLATVTLLPPGTHTFFSIVAAPARLETGSAPQTLKISFALSSAADSSPLNSRLNVGTCVQGENVE